MLVQRAGEHEAQQVNGHLGVPAPARSSDDARRAGLEAGVVRLLHRRRRHIRVDVDRDIEFDCGGEQRVVARMVEKAAFRRAVDQAAEKAELFHATD